MEEVIKQIVLGLGADLCGIAGIDRFSGTPEGFHPRDIYRNCRSVVVFAKRLPKGVAFVDPRIVYNQANEINKSESDHIAFNAAIAIENLGCIAVPLPSDGPYDYWDSENMTGKGILSMRHAAVLAGLGSIGKNTLLINGDFGSLLCIGAILTDMDLKSDGLSDDICIENCRLCLDACPVQALNGISVMQKRCRPHAYGTNDRGFSVTNCNKCRMVCPRVFGIK